MSNDIAYLALRFEGPLQAWGFDSQYSRRNTGLFPTKSAILGMCCAALGLTRGSREEAELLTCCGRLRLLAIAVPRSVRYGEERRELSVRRITDYHTVQHTKTAEGKIKDTHLTHRQYLCDSAFACVLSGDTLLVNQFGRALENPVWGIYLGRKACIPTAPVLVGVFASEPDALRALLGDRLLESFSRQREVTHFDDGTDSLPDEPICFASPNGIRRFAPRRVRLSEGGQGK
ncbi:MAG: type I-E CRISPR-associated protein Cas5/CasD, partial [Acidobacteriales bacterium]|nr:type I-E CRISPR-associated protein Cas5/CasD [Terriglobales bacterium]